MNEAPTIPTANGAPAFAETLLREPESAALARTMVRGALARWDLPELAEAAELIVSELVANAVDHARGNHIRVTVVRTRADRVRIAVVDRGTVRPEMRTVPPEADRGRGLVLIDAMSHGWGVHPMAWGKRVWADLDAEEL